MFSTLEVFPKSEIFYLTDSNVAEKLLLRQLYRTGIDRPLVIECYGEIDIAEESFADYRTTAITSRRRQNLQGLTLQASMVITNNDTLNHLSDHR